MKTLTFEERYFRNAGEWEYFLNQLGIPEEEQLNISEIEVKVDSFEITDTWERE